MTAEKIALNRETLSEFHKLVNSYFDGITIADLMQTEISRNYSI